jgi:acetyltransferase-like isoleucine patch superfamily enzyme
MRRLLTVLADVPRRAGYLWGPRVMSALRKRWVLARNPHLDIRFEGPVYLGRGFSIHGPERATFVVGPWVEFRRGFRVELARGAVVRIGGGCRFTYDVLIQCGERVEIGKGCMFGQSSAIFDGNHRFRDIERPMLEQGYDLRPVRIEDEAIVTTKCTIIGATIGRRAFIGANSVVTRDIPPYVVAVGAPARPIEYFGPEDQRPAEVSASRSDRSG